MSTPPVTNSSRRAWLIRSGGLLLAYAPALRQLIATVNADAQGTTAADFPISDVMTTLT
jgi:hypothetical protein